MTDSTGSVPLRIFMSYRREDTGWAAVSLFDRLAGHYGRDRIFKDVDSIDLGDDFVEAITTAVGSCHALLALIGKQWLTVTDQNGRRRLDNSGDFVRLEIEAALTRGVRVIPILVDGARMPHADQLPGSLAPLARRQALELNPNRFGSDFQRLLPVLVGFQNSAAGPDLGFYAARSYSLMRPPRTGRRMIRSAARSAAG